MMRLAVPSWVIPGTYRENLVFLAEQPAISAVELLFFFYDQETKALLQKELPAIGELGRRFRYSLHLPEPLLPRHEELVAKTFPLIDRYVFHPGPREGHEALAGLIEAFDRGRGRFLLENTRNDQFEALLGYLPKDAGICMDTGHLLLEGTEPLSFYRRFPERIQEIHLHGLDPAKAQLDGRLTDHRPLRLEDRWFKDLVPVLAAFTGTVNLEVFSWEEACESLAVLSAAGLCSPAVGGAL